MKAQNPILDNEYKSRINKIFDYIETHIDQPFSLEELAEQANFSKFHFHRIFTAMVGETPFQFIQRIRLEKAATCLLMNSSESITNIAFRCGFSDISIFSRNFKSHFNLSPSSYRETKLANSNNRQMNSKTAQEELKSSMYFCFESQTIKWRTKMKLNKSVEVKTLPQKTVAYLRHTGPYKGDEQLFEKLWNQLFAWAGPRGLFGKPEFSSQVIYHDDPNITEQGKLRMSVSIGVAEDTKVDGEIGKMIIEGGEYVVARFEVEAHQFQEAWEWVYGQWLPTSGYQPDDRPCFEVYPEEPKNGKFTVDICIPVKPI
ncbi:GyrI-like domain-containing protein [Lentimicrobium sp. S6]|uniref:AraC family transcriptional regulator n=1 Tax=Lentimicrobium sp. S6 TaxID=2735872 RepID=UPI00155185F3|nr:GyrI-like domain-containing protein [Lentimicrobium sp. S6]NPD45720.1 AraC family transcriptional regulator [Lentimicrobium sp. S6]